MLVKEMKMYVILRMMTVLSTVLPHIVADVCTFVPVLSTKQLVFLDIFKQKGSPTQNYLQLSLLGDQESCVQKCCDIKTDECRLAVFKKGAAITEPNCFLYLCTTDTKCRFIRYTNVAKAKHADDMTLEMIESFPQLHRRVKREENNNTAPPPPPVSTAAATPAASTKSTTTPHSTQQVKTDPATVTQQPASGNQVTESSAAKIQTPPIEGNSITSGNQKMKTTVQHEAGKSVTEAQTSTLVANQNLSNSNSLVTGKTSNRTTVPNKQIQNTTASVPSTTQQVPVVTQKINATLASHSTERQKANTTSNTTLNTTHQSTTIPQIHPPKPTTKPEHTTLSTTSISTGSQVSAQTNSTVLSDNTTILQTTAYPPISNTTIKPPSVNTTIPSNSVTASPPIRNTTIKPPSVNTSISSNSVTASPPISDTTIIKSPTLNTTTPSNSVTTASTVPKTTVINNSTNKSLTSTQTPPLSISSAKPPGGAGGSNLMTKSKQATSTASGHTPDSSSTKPADKTESTTHDTTTESSSQSIVNSTTNSTDLNAKRSFMLSLKSLDGKLIAVLIFALSLGLIFFIAVVALVGRRAYESWQRRHYSRIDYLVNGMYN